MWDLIIGTLVNEPRKDSQLFKEILQDILVYSEVVCVILKMTHGKASRNEL